jgi:ubiquitin carboxyl-terminal hydrolase L5
VHPHTPQLHFNLMAICGDRVMELRRRIDALDAVEGSMAQTAREDVGLQKAQLQAALSDQLAKKERWAVNLHEKERGRVGSR